MASPTRVNAPLSIPSKSSQKSLAKASPAHEHPSESHVIDIPAEEETGEMKPLLGWQTALAATKAMRRFLSNIESRKVAITEISDPEVHQSSDNQADEVDHEPHPWKEGQQFIHLQPSADNPWATVKKGIDKLDGDRCKGWNSELDAMLIFTGLFSAVVTAFCIESVKRLSQDPIDATNALLMVLISKSAGDSGPYPGTSNEAFIPQRHEAHINVLYFISLTLTLSISSVCILAKQWIREYQTDYVRVSSDAVRVRQARSDSLQAWKLPQILLTLPVILQAALLVFFGGLVDQLWHVNDHSSAIAVSIIFGMSVTVLSLTTILPAHCTRLAPGYNFPPFRSPQAWVYLSAYRHFKSTCLRAYRLVSCGSSWWLPYPVPRSWGDSDQSFLKLLQTPENAHFNEDYPWENHNAVSVQRALRRIGRVFRDDSEMVTSLFWCLQMENYLQQFKLEGKTLATYALYGDTKNQLHPDELRELDIISDVYFDLSDSLSKASHAPGPTWERFQAELLIRSTNTASDILKDKSTGRTDEDLSRLWEGAAKTCNHLKGMSENMLKPSDGTNSKEDEYVVPLVNQIATMLRRFLAAVDEANCCPPSEASAEIVGLLVSLRKGTSSFLRNTTMLRIPPYLVGIFAKRTSSLVEVANFIIRHVERSSGNSTESSGARRLDSFFVLDEIMVGICNKEAEVDQKDMEAWICLRQDIVDGSSDDLGVKLSDDYFEGKHPCRSLQSLDRAMVIEMNRRGGMSADEPGSTDWIQVDTKEVPPQENIPKTWQVGV